MADQQQLDTSLDSLVDPPLQGDYLQKRVQSILALDCSKDESLKSSLLSLELDEQFITKNLVHKAKQYDYIPIAYNAQLITNHIRYNQQKQHLLFYQALNKSQLQIEERAKDLLQHIDLFKENYDKGNNMIQHVIRDAQRLNKDNITYQEQLSELQAKKQILSSLYRELTFTEQEKQILFEDDEEQEQREDDGQEEELRFDRFKFDFFKALGKLNKMEEILELINQDQDGQTQLAKSIQESIKFVEDNAYVKLVKHLKDKIRIFDTPLENQPEFLTFMKVTLKMLRQKSQELYSHIINELINSRAKYIELSYQEKISLIQAQTKQSKDKQQQNISKIVALYIAWLHEALLNELQILDHTSLDQAKYLDAINQIFSRKLAKQIKQKLDQEIAGQEDFFSAFELYYLIISFYQIMHDQFVVKLKILAKDDLSDLIVLSFFQELKYKSLIKLNECSDLFLDKFHGLFYSQASQTPLQLERLIQLVSKIFSKLLEVIKNDKRDLEIFKKKVLLYAITRILPHTSSGFLEDSSIIPQNLVQLFNYYDELSKVITKDMLLQFKDENELINERIDYLSSCLKKASFIEFERKQNFNTLMNSDSLDIFRATLEDLEEELEYEEVKISALHGIQNESMKQLIAEMVKEEVIGKLKESLGNAVESEFLKISEDQFKSEEEKEKVEKLLNYMEFELVEKIEYVKKKISS